MSNFNQLLLFELTEEVRIEITGYLEFDFNRFPNPNSMSYFGDKRWRGMWEAEEWIRRSKSIDDFIDKHFKNKT